MILNLIEPLNFTNNPFGSGEKNYKHDCTVQSLDK